MARSTRSKVRALKRGAFKWPILTPESLGGVDFELPAFRDAKTRRLQENAQLRVALMISQQQAAAIIPSGNSPKLPNAVSGPTLFAKKNDTGQAKGKKCFPGTKISHAGRGTESYSPRTSLRPRTPHIETATAVGVLPLEQKPSQESVCPDTAATSLDKHKRTFTPESIHRFIFLSTI